MTSSRYGRLVVRNLRSCLGGLRSKGIDDSGYGCDKWGKNHHIDQKGPDIVVQRTRPPG